MVNHSQISRDNSIEIDEVLKTLGIINEELFSGKLPIENKSNIIYVCLIGYHGVNLKIKDGIIDIRHQDHVKFYWWLEHLICCELSNRLKGSYFDDGVGEMGKENGIYTYSSFENFVTRNIKNRMGKKLPFKKFITKKYKKMIMEETYNILPKDLYYEIIKIKPNV